MEPITDTIRGAAVEVIAALPGSAAPHDEWLRGQGAREMSAPGPMPRIFVSYAHADRAWLRSLVTHLRGALGSSDPDFIFFDENSLRSGDAWSDRLRQEVESREQQR